MSLHRNCCCGDDLVCPIVFCGCGPGIDDNGQIILPGPQVPGGLINWAECSDVDEPGVYRFTEGLCGFVSSEGGLDRSDPRLWYRMFPGTMEGSCEECCEDPLPSGPGAGPGEPEPDPPPADEACCVPFTSPNPPAFPLHKLSTAPMTLHLRVSFSVFGHEVQDSNCEDQPCQRIDGENEIEVELISATQTPNHCRLNVSEAIAAFAGNDCSSSVVLVGWEWVGSERQVRIEASPTLTIQNPGFCSPTYAYGTPGGDMEDEELGPQLRGFQSFTFTIPRSDGGQSATCRIMVSWQVTNAGICGDRDEVAGGGGSAELAMAEERMSHA